MSMLREEELSGQIKEWITRTRNEQNLSAVKVDVKEDMDLIANGILDSIGFIELLVYVESITGQKINLSDLDPDEFTSIKGLSRNPIVETYSKLADQYDEDKNNRSCWGISAEKALASIRPKEHCEVVVDVGCGTGRALVHLAGQSRPHVLLIGIEPALNMRNRAIELTERYPNIRIVDGSFENLPLETASVDHLYSIHAFHWTTDLIKSVKELSRVIKPTGEMDLFFIGRNNGHEFIRKTTPIFLKYMGPTLLLES
ncbi:MAG: methyltransferase domain-containing protein, partial [Nitrospirae bacterium]